ncbi:MAG: ThiF family adenylyltransferase [Holophagales bacterium]|jgi:adenylyltransferase/sulfurtransferase|nr:ThiF family adenylyltransferase [Holophagales bacterium]
MTRYAKQRIFLGLGRDDALRSASVAIVGLGATGGAIAAWLARAGVGHMTLIDRDLVDLTNLQRQILYSEADIGKPKALAARDALHGANSEIDISPLVTDLTSGNALAALSGYDLIMDGTDNFEARYLINDVSILKRIPWVYCGAIGSEAMAWPIAPPATPCLRCLMEAPPEAGDVDTCDSAGVLGPAVGVAASWAAMEAIKILTSGPQDDALEKRLARFDLWKNERQFIAPPVTRCKYCTNQITEFLDSKWSVKATELCGLDGVQIRVNPPGDLDLLRLKPRLEARTGSEWKHSPLALSGCDGGLKVTIFKDGRTLLHGKISIERARGWYSEVVGC